MVVAIVAFSGGGHKRLPPPAHLPALTQIYANKAIGVTGAIPRDWTAVRGPGFVQLASHDRRAIIVIAAQSVAPGSSPPLLRTALVGIRKTYGAYGPVKVRHAPGTTLAGLRARSVVAYGRNRRHVVIRVLLAATQTRRLAYLLEAFTSKEASVHDLAEAQEAVLGLRLKG